MELKDTIEMMQSEYYKDGFEAEYHPLVKWENGTLNFEPSCPRSMFNMQIRAMTDCITSLEAHAAIEGIDL